MRKVIQITSAPWEGSVALTALCDDGTMWEMNSGRWVELPAMVQDESKDPLAVAAGRIQRAMKYASDVIRSGLPQRSGSLVALNVNSILRGADEGCQARQHSDQMVCEKCGIGWDMNDQAPPTCVIVASVKG